MVAIVSWVLSGAGLDVGSSSVLKTGAASVERPQPGL